MTVPSFVRALLLAFSLMLAGPSLAAAQNPAPAPPPAQASPQRTTGFVAAKTPTTVPGGPLLLGAYAIVWTLLFGYLFSVRRRQQEVEDEMRDLLGEVKELRAAAIATAAAPATAEEAGDA